MQITRYLQLIYRTETLMHHCNKNGQCNLQASWLQQQLGGGNS